MIAHKYRQGDEVWTSELIEGVILNGKICGLTTGAITLLGEGYIIESTDGFLPNEDYPYTHFTAFESQLSQGEINK